MLRGSASGGTAGLDGGAGLRWCARPSSATWHPATGLPACLPPSRPSALGPMQRQVWMLIIILSGRPVFTASIAILSAAALGSLATTRSMCGRALEAAGIGTPLSQLYSLLSMAQ